MRKRDKLSNMVSVNRLIETRYLKEKGLLNEGVTKRKLLVLVGPPSVGKSTWTKKNFPDAYIISRDDIVEQVASDYGLVYNDMFKVPPPDSKLGDVDGKYGTVVESPSWMTWSKFVYDKVFKANGEVTKRFNDRVSNAHPSGKDIVVDMTNMNVDSRKSAMKTIENNLGDYHKIAVDFKFKGSEEIIKKMAQKRSKESGDTKTISDEVFDGMFKRYSPPSKSEGFDDIIDVDNIENLKRGLENHS